jgi:hypothetical protein
MLILNMRFYKIHAKLTMSAKGQGNIKSTQIKAEIFKLKAKG